MIVAPESSTEVTPRQSCVLHLCAFSGAGTFPPGNGEGLAQEQKHVLGLQSMDPPHSHGRCSRAPRTPSKTTHLYGLQTEAVCGGGSRLSPWPWQTLCCLHVPTVLQAQQRGRKLREGTHKFWTSAFFKDRVCHLPASLFISCMALGEQWRHLTESPIFLIWRWKWCI